MAGYWLCVMMHIVMSSLIVLDNLRVNNIVFQLIRELGGLLLLLIGHVNPLTELLYFVLVFRRQPTIPYSYFCFVSIRYTQRR